MKISGFSFVKNASKLYLPIKASIESVLPLVDEFVIAVGDNDPDDNTREIIESIGSNKIKIIDTVWDYNKYPRGTEFAHQTDIAKEACHGDWLFYIQGDEVIHEKDHDTIYRRCEQLLPNKKVEALFFKWLHFYGDYQHYQISHGWYKNEIRIIRNDPDIHSWRDAQSFRRIPNFDGVNYRQEKNTYKLHAAPVGAYIYHYGWVRPLKYQMRKKEERKANYHKKEVGDFTYGPLGYLKKFDGTHPKWMKEWLDKFDWGGDLNYSRTIHPHEKDIKHCRLKYRLLTCIEQNILGGRGIAEGENFIRLKV